MEALLFKVEGTTEKVTPENGKHFNLQELYKMLDCEMVEVIYLPDSQLLIFDEEGKLKNGAKVNALATRLFWRCGGNPTDAIVGHCLLCDRKMFK